jgi:thiamine transport system permease protein
MANRAGKVSAVTAGGAAVAAALTLMCFGTLAAVFWRAGEAGIGPADGAVIRFTVLQAAVSALISVVLAVPVARAFARRQFAGRSILITLLGAPFLVPIIVAMLGLLEVFGRSGLLNTALAAVGLPRISIYGFHGVVLAHVFFNLPLAVRMVLQGWQAIPAERFRLAAALGFAPADVLRHLERPMLREVLPGAALVIFTLCLSSFAVALTLGGGPRATTVELAIYQALRFDFDLGRAAVLSALQFALCAGAVVLSLQVAKGATFGAGLDRPAQPWSGLGRISALQDGAAIGLAALFLILPLLMLVIRGLPGLMDLPTSIWPALARSLVVAALSTGLTMTAAVFLALAVVQGRFAKLLELAAMLPLAVSGLVLGTGLFLIVQSWIAVEKLALPVTALVNATLALPFVLRIVLPALRNIDADYGRLAASLSLTGMAQWRWVILPRLRAPLGFAAGLVAALSIGDLGVVALFAGDRGVTLPLLVQRLMGAYRMDAAAGAALVLISVSFAVFWLLDREGRRHADP